MQSLKNLGNCSILQQTGNWAPENVDFILRYLLTIGSERFRTERFSQQEEFGERGHDKRHMDVQPPAKK